MDLEGLMTFLKFTNNDDTENIPQFDADQLIEVALSFRLKPERLRQIDGEYFKVRERKLREKKAADREREAKDNLRRREKEAAASASTSTSGAARGGVPSLAPMTATTTTTTTTITASSSSLTNNASPNSLAHQNSHSHSLVDHSDDDDDDDDESDSESDSPRPPPSPRPPESPPDFDAPLSPRPPPMPPPPEVVLAIASMLPCTTTDGHSPKTPTSPISAIVAALPPPLIHAPPSQSSASLSVAMPHDAAAAADGAAVNGTDHQGASKRNSFGKQKTARAKSRDM